MVALEFEAPDRMRIGLRVQPVFRWNNLLVDFVPTPYSLEADWRSLQAQGTASAFQSWGFVNHWLTKASAAAGESPFFVVGRLEGGTRFILPMALVKRGGVRVLQWLAQSHSNYGMGLLHPETLAIVNDSDADRLLLEIARRVEAAVVFLDKQPARWDGRKNPFVDARRSLLTPNDTFILALDADYKAQYKRLYPGRALQPLKRRQRRLEEMGALSFSPPEGDLARKEAIDWFVSRKRDQLAQIHRRSPFDDAGIHALYYSMADDPGIFEIEQVTVGGVRAAVGLTLRSEGIAHGLNTSHAAEFSRGSPGTLLQHRIVEAAHERGARAYDFGPGLVPYKLDWKPDIVPLLATAKLLKPQGLRVYAGLVIRVIAGTKITRSQRLQTIERKIRFYLAKLKSVRPKAGE